MIYLMCGLPGSGKSTWARKKREELTKDQRLAVIVSRDDIRSMLHGGRYVFDNELEGVINSMVYNSVKLLSDDFLVDDVIVDECSIRRSSRVYFLNRFLPRDVTLVYCHTKESLLNRRMDDPRDFGTAYWKTVIERMRRAFERPDRSEGFTRFINVNTDTKKRACSSVG